MPWWFTPDVTTWAKTNEEAIGRRPKSWVVDATGTKWLRKEPIAWRSAELAVEAFTLELARRCEYSVAFGCCCTWQVDGGGTMRGFVSRIFHDATEQQTTGGRLIEPHIELPTGLSADEAEDRRRIGTTLTLTRAVLQGEQSRYQVELLRPFLRMLVFDAWIGNGDRHSENWAHLVRSARHGSACRLAPMYDTAGCLLAEVGDEAIERRFGRHREADAIERYIDKCPSGFGDGGNEAGIRQRDLLRQLQAWPEWSEVARPLISYFSDNLSMVTTLLDEIPADWLSDRRKELMHALLGARVKLLEGFVST